LREALYGKLVAQLSVWTLSSIIRTPTREIRGRIDLGYKLRALGVNNLQNSVLNSLELREYILGRIYEDPLALKPLLLYAVDVLVIEVYLR
jgi:hypothetical protein